MFMWTKNASGHGAAILFVTIANKISFAWIEKLVQLTEGMGLLPLKIEGDQQC